MPPSGPIVSRVGYYVVNTNDKTMLAEAMQAMATVLPPALSSVDIDRSDDTSAALEQFERAMALFGAASGQSLTPGGASKWLRDVGHNDLSEMLRSATRYLQTIEDFVTEWVAHRQDEPHESDEPDAPPPGWRAEALRDDRGLRPPSHAWKQSKQRTPHSYRVGAQSFCEMTVAEARHRSGLRRRRRHHGHQVSRRSLPSACRRAARR